VKYGWNPEYTDSRSLKTRLSISVFANPFYPGMYFAHFNMNVKIHSLAGFFYTFDRILSICTHLILRFVCITMALVKVAWSSLRLEFGSSSLAAFGFWKEMRTRAFVCGSEPKRPSGSRRIHVTHLLEDVLKHLSWHSTEISRINMRIDVLMFSYRRSIGLLRFSI